MTNLAAVIALSYRGTDLQTDPIGLFLEIVEGLWNTASVRGTDIVVPARVGRIRSGRVKDTRIIRLQGYVSGTDIDETGLRSDFQTRMLQLQALFDPAIEGNLVATLTDGTVALIAALPQPTMLIEQIVPSMARVNIELESVTPEWDLDYAGS